MFSSRHIYCPVHKLYEILPLAAELELGVEVLFESTEDLWPELRWENILPLADALAEVNLPVTVHGPFHGLNMGTRDHHIPVYSRDVLLAALEAARVFRSPLMVFHSGCLPQYQPKAREQWFDTFSEGLIAVLEKAGDMDVQLALENTYEPDTSLFEAIFERFPSPQLGMCLDTGHATCFGKIEPSHWAERFGERICHIHCSDNDGRDDLHWALGSGVVNFAGILAPLAALGGNVSLTLEVAPEDARSSRDYLEKLVSSNHDPERP